MKKEEITSKILNSKKYKYIDEKLVNSLVNRYGDVDKVKSKLHQIWGAYYSTRPNFQKILKKYSNEEISVDNILRIHSSTRERINDYEEMYTYIFDIIGHQTQIYDVGCGLNPLFFLLLNIDYFDRYICIDIDKEQQYFLSEIFKIVNRNNIEVKVGEYVNQEITSNDSTFLLKILPVLDQQKENGSIELLSKILTKYLVVTFPNKSIGGIEKGMKENYFSKYIPILSNCNFELISQKEFSRESVYIFRNKNRE